MTPRSAGRRGPRARRCEALILYALYAFGAAPLTGQAVPAADVCASCHLGLADSALAAPASEYPDDIHARQGFGCLVCHGGPRTGRGALDADAGFLSVPSRAEVPALCGRCHSDAVFMRNYNPNLRVDQVEEYYTSRHGRLLAQGDSTVATCIDCHPAHRIRPPQDLASSVHPLRVADLCASCHGPGGRTEERGLPTDQLEEYRTSVHGALLYEDGDVSAPTCNDCHGNHGATPPGFASVRNVCGQCHTVMADFFASSGHVEHFDRTNRPGCATCHGNHGIEVTSDADLTRRTESVCASCHDEDDPDRDAFLAMGVLIDSLRHERERALELLHTAEDAGMEVSEAIFALDGVDNALTMARSAVHTFSTGPVAEAAGEGFAVTSEARERGVEAMEEHSYRRLGLGVSASIIFVLILTLLLKIRDAERGGSHTPSHAEALLVERVARGLGGGGPEREEAVRQAAHLLLVTAAQHDAVLDATDRHRLRDALGRSLAAHELARLDVLVAPLDPDAVRRLLVQRLDVLERVEVLGVSRGLLPEDRGTPGADRTILRRIVQILELSPTGAADTAGSH